MPKLSPEKAAKEAKERNLHVPPPSYDGRHPTLSDADGYQYGAMSDQMDTELSEFVKIASDPNAKVLEIGAAYGSPYLMEAFKNNTSAHYTASDILGDQLQILARQIEEKYPNKFKTNLSLVEGAFPHKEVTDYLEEGGYDAIMASSIFHFFTEEEVAEGFKQVYRLLKPGGKFFARMTTPYLGFLNPDVIEKMSNDVKNFLDNFHEKKRPYPGFLEQATANMKESVDEKVLTELGVTKLKNLFMFDKEITKLILDTDGFNTESCEYKPRTSPPFYLDGREYLVLVAEKPKH